MKVTSLFLKSALQWSFFFLFFFYIFAWTNSALVFPVQLSSAAPLCALLPWVLIMEEVCLIYSFIAV